MCEGVILPRHSPTFELRFRCLLARPRTRHSDKTFSGFHLPHYFIGHLSAEAQFCVVTLAKSAGDTYKMKLGLECECANLSKVVFREVLLFLQGRLNRNYVCMHRWCMMYDVWYMMYDVWCVMYGVWCVATIQVLATVRPSTVILQPKRISCQSFQQNMTNST